MHLTPECSHCLFVPAPSVFPAPPSPRSRSRWRVCLPTCRSCRGGGCSALGNLPPCFCSFPEQWKGPFWPRGRGDGQEAGAGRGPCAPAPDPLRPVASVFPACSPRAEPTLRERPVTPPASPPSCQDCPRSRPNVLPPPQPPFLPPTPPGPFSPGPATTADPVWMGRWEGCRQRWGFPETAERLRPGLPGAEGRISAGRGLDLCGPRAHQPGALRAFLTARRPPRNPQPPSTTWA